MLNVEEARHKLLQGIDAVTATERLEVSCALGRVLAEDIEAPISLPPFANSAMDGYAVSSSDPTFSGTPPYRLRVVGRSLAGRPWPGRLEVGAVRIFTGAAIPPGADTVIVQEEAHLHGNVVEFSERPSANRHIRAIGNDIQQGGLLCARGTRLRAFDLGWIAACGVRHLQAFRRPRVGIFATGDELREPGTALSHGQIYESNRLMLSSLAAPLPVHIHDLGILPDAPAPLESALAEAAETQDMLITSGGVSVGESDLVRAVLSKLGTVDFWRVAIKPGKPFAFGRIGECLFMGLPGNPASAIVTFLLFVAPAILELAGAKPEPPVEFTARLSVRTSRPQNRSEYQRAQFTRDEQGLWVRPTGGQDSNRIGSFRNANCLIRLEPGAHALRAGTKVPVLPFHGLLAG